MSVRKAIVVGPALILAILLVVLPFTGCPSDNGGNGTECECNSDLDCGAGSLCSDACKCYVCECRADRDCGMGRKCSDCTCSETCSSDADCQTADRPDAVCYAPRRACYGGETCQNTSECSQPVVGHQWVTCNDFQGKCVASIPTCTRETLASDCPAGMVCKEGVCADRPALCQSDDDCPAEEVCNVGSNECIPDANCEQGKCMDPVDGFCRTCPCDRDSDCKTEEWCDQFTHQGCRKKCAANSDCLQGEGEECQADGTCRQAISCNLDEDCENCQCTTGLTCVESHRLGKEICRPACDIYDNDCAAGELCQPVRDGATYPVKGGGCVLGNGGRDAGQACDLTNFCEANILCQAGTCRGVCNPGGQPGCEVGVDCNDYMGIGVCGDVAGCGSDGECAGWPDKICWNQECEPGCHMPATPVTCDAIDPCEPSTGRCKGGGICTADIDCNPPDTICDLEIQPPDCRPSCTSVGCPGEKRCDPTSGRCKDKCANDAACGPPASICENDVCIKGCAEPGGMDCGASDCIEATGRCGTVSSCTVDADCNPPMTKCDEPWQQCIDGCGLTNCDAGYTCENTSGECVYSPCTHISCPCTSIADCDSGLMCGFFSKTCTKSCTVDGDCTPYYCNGGFCG